MLQIILTIFIYLIMVIPVGTYVYHVAAGTHTFADPVLNRVDGAIYKICGINPQHDLEKICRFSGGDQRGHDAAGICHFADPEYWPAQSERDRQYGGITLL